MGDCMICFVEGHVYSYMAHFQHKGKNKVPYIKERFYIKLFFMETFQTPTAWMVRIMTTLFFLRIKDFHPTNLNNVWSLQGRFGIIWMKCFLSSEGILQFHYFLPGNHHFTITINMLIVLFTFIHLPDFIFCFISLRFTPASSDTADNRDHTDSAYLTNAPFYLCRSKAENKNADG